MLAKIGTKNRLHKRTIRAGMINTLFMAVSNSSYKLLASASGSCAQIAAIPRPSGERVNSTDIVEELGN
jgi:hypothetical protein